MCLFKSPEKHYRLFMRAAPMANGVSEDDFKARGRYLANKYYYDITKAGKKTIYRLQKGYAR